MSEHAGAEQPQAQRIAVCGSREFESLGQVRDYIARVAKKYPDATIIVGYDPEQRTPRGVDEAAYNAARAANLNVECYPALWKSKYGKRSGFVRNWRMLARATTVIAFWDMSSHGTAHDILIARYWKLPLFVYNALAQRVDEQTLEQCLSLTGVDLMFELVPTPDECYQVTTSFACAAVYVEDEEQRIVRAAPIFAKWCGRSLAQLQEYYAHKRELQSIVQIDEWPYDDKQPDRVIYQAPA